MGLLRLFGFRFLTPAEPVVAELPYRRRDDFLSAAELSFYRVLITVTAGRATVCPKVNLSDVFFVVDPKINQAHRNRIDRKHVDFLLCDLATLKPIGAIELDDASHQRPDRQRRDQLVDDVFAAAGLPLVRVPARFAYDTAELSATIEPLWRQTSRSAPPRATSETGDPICPKCGVPMMVRIAKRGPNAGQTFFGCSNYPKCRETRTV